MSRPTRRRVLVTGATGIVGSYIARALAADPAYEVRATKRATSSTVLLADCAAQIDWVTGDLLDLDVQAEAMRDVDAVVHAAGLVSYRPQDAAALKRVNTDLTEDLVNLALELGIDHFVHMSSIAAISPPNANEVVSEAHQTFHPQANTTRYALSKRAAELHVWRGKEEGLPITILNPSVVLGAGVWEQSSCRLFGWVAAGQRFYPPGGTGYVDVRDVAAFAKTCLDQRLADERYVLNAENWTYKRFFDAVAAELAVAPPHIEVNAWQAELARRVEAARALLTRRDPLLTKESARRSLHTSRFDNAKSVAAGAMYRGLETTLQDIARSFLATRASGWGVV